MDSSGKSVCIECKIMLLIQRNLDKMEKQADRNNTWREERKENRKRYITFRVHIFDILPLP